MKKNVLGLWLIFCVSVFAVFTAKAVSNYTSMSAIRLNQSIIDSSPIGSTTPSTGAFTTLSATGGITGNLTGSVTGNASTASALAGAPGQCSGGTPVSTGIQASGTANCTAFPAIIIGNKGSTSCSPAGSSFATCPDSITWRTGTFPNTNYEAVCNLQAPISGGGGSNALTVYPSAATSTTTLSVTVMNLTSDSGTTANDIVCYGQEL